MTPKIDARYLTDTLKELVEVDSPVGYYNDIHDYLRGKFAELGYEMEVDNKATGYVPVRGRDSQAPVVCVGAHLDTIGLIVRGFNDDGTLRVRQLGGINYPVSYTHLTLPTNSRV